MTICFVDAESAEQGFYAERIKAQCPPHTPVEVRFVGQLETVPADAEVVSIFLQHTIDETFLDVHKGLKLIVARSYSTDHIDLEACHERGVAVCAVPAYGEVSVAEHTFALILALSRKLRQLMLMPSQGSFSYETCRGFELAGKTLGLIGCGRIGRHVARLARGFSMKLLVTDPVQDPAAVQDLGIRYVELDELLTDSHVVSLHANLTPQTHHILNQETLAKCRPGVLIINTSRGRLIDTAALREALDSGHVGGAGLDVLQDERVMRQSAARILSAEIVKNLRGGPEHCHPTAGRVKDVEELVLSSALLSRPNVVFTPHVAFNSEEAVVQLREATVANLIGYLTGKPINLVTA